MAYLLAVDGGGTKTEFALMEPDGKIVRRVSLGPSNYQNIGADAARNVLRDGLSQVAEEARGELLGACLGLAGLDTAQDERIYSAMVGDLFGDAAAKVRIENDCFIALHCGTLGAAGIAIIAGTGSMAIGMNEAGERARSGGWGYRFGDEGSGYYIGYQALVRAVRARDGRAPETQLAALIEEKVGMPLFDLVVRYTAEDPGPDAVGALAPLVTEAALAGDEVAPGSSPMPRPSSCWRPGQFGTGFPSLAARYPSSCPEEPSGPIPCASRCRRAFPSSWATSSAFCRPCPL